MKTFLVVRESDGRIVNAVEYDGDAPYSLGEGLFLTEQTNSYAWIGWTWDGERLTPPQEYLDGGWSWDGEKYVPPPPLNENGWYWNGVEYVAPPQEFLDQGWTWNGTEWVLPEPE